MDNMPVRGSGSAANRTAPAAHRPESRPSAVTEELPKNEEPVRHTTKYHRTTHVEEKSPKRKLIIWIVAVIVAVAVIALALIAWLMRPSDAVTGIDDSKYQAVFFTNGQVYFGKLHAFNSEYMKLTDVYYLQTQASEEADSENPQQTSTNQNNPTLIKLGDEIHGPEDEMIVSKDQVLFYENLKSDGKVAQSIEKHKNSN